MATTLRKLQVIEYSLTPRDKEILKTLRNTKCLFTYQVRRVFFTEAINPQAAARATNRNLKKLRDYGLIDALVGRRVGGVRAGSASYIWYLTEQGNRLLDMDKKYPENKPKRTRFTEPADTTLGHRMAIAECFVQLKEISYREDGFRIKEVVFEPDNWHHYIYKDKREVLKPDLFTVVAHHHFEYRYMIEIDLGTESISTVIGKCIRYRRYFQSGIEQEAHGVFPTVLWIVKDEKRKDKMEEAIREEFKSRHRIFLVITADEFGDTMTTSDVRARLL